MKSAVDRYQDVPMSFGEHLEELRQHLVRALYGTGVALVLMMFYGDQVVRLLVDPVEHQLERYYREQLKKRIEVFERAQELLAAEDREQIEVPLTLDPPSLQALRQALSGEVTPQPKDEAAKPATQAGPATETPPAGVDDAAAPLRPPAPQPVSPGAPNAKPPNKVPETDDQSNPKPPITEPQDLTDEPVLPQKINTDVVLPNWPKPQPKAGLGDGGEPRQPNPMDSVETHTSLPKPAPGLTLRIKMPVTTLLRKLSLPLAEINGRWRLKALSAQEGFVIWFKAVLGAALVVSAPWIFYQLYSFVAIGLYAHERRFVHLTLPFSVLLFLLGVFVCYFLVMPSMLNFFLLANQMIEIEPEIRLNEWVGFAVMLMLIFGFTFQMPLAMLMLERVGILTYEMLKDKRKWAVFVNFILAAFVSPGGDPWTMLFLAVPLCFLFELGLTLMWYFQRHNPFRAGDEPEEDYL